MRTTKLGDRKGAQYYLDLRQGWRMGDFAGLRMLLEHWRIEHVAEHVTLSYGNHHWRSVYGSQLDLPWIFSGVIDTLHEMENSKDLIQNGHAMIGTPMLGKVFSPHIWNDWYKLRNRVVTSGLRLEGIKPPADVMEQVDTILKRKGVTGDYVTVHPLFDAGYNKYRNGSKEWWSTLIDSLSRYMKVVVIGTAGYAQHIHVPENAVQLFDLGLPAMLSLGVIAKAKLHVGGETGLTLWAGVCGVPVLATYGRWGAFKDKARRLADFRPIPFTQPVMHAPLNGDTQTIAQLAVGMIGHSPSIVTPLPAERVLPPSVVKLDAPPPPATAQRRVVRSPRPRPAPVAATVKQPAKTLKQLLAERRARRSKA